MSFFIVLENDIMQRTFEDIYYLSRIWVKKKPYKRELIYMYSKNHHIPCFYSGDIAKYVTLPNPELDNLSTSLLYFTGSEQNALSLQGRIHDM